MPQAPSSRAGRPARSRCCRRSRRRRPRGRGSSSCTRSAALLVRDVGPPWVMTTSGGRSPGGRSKLGLRRCVEERVRRAASHSSGSRCDAAAEISVGRRPAASTPGGRSLAPRRRSKRATTVGSRRRARRRRRSPSDAHGEAQLGGRRPTSATGLPGRGARGGRGLRGARSPTTEPSGAKPNVVSPKTHWGSANSASIGASASSSAVVASDRGSTSRCGPRRSGGPVGRPLGWTIDSSGPPATGRRAQPAVRRRSARPRVRGVPRHVRLVPRQPRQPWPSGDGRDAARKSCPATRRARRPVERDGHDRVRGCPGPAVVLANGEDPAPADVEPKVRVAHGPGGERDWRRRRRVDAVQAAVGEVREDDEAIVDRVGAAAVLVDPGADVDRRGRQVGGGAVGRRADEDPPPAFGRPRLEPVGVVAVEPRLGQADDVADEVVDADRRRPRAVRARPRRVGHRLRSRAARRRRSRPARGSSASSVIPRAASLRRATSASIASGTT